MLSSLAQAQYKNPNNLPQCPQIDSSKFIHFGTGGRTEKWTNCWGRYVAELNDVYKGDIFEGEWQNGKPHGQGTYYYLADNKAKGDKHVGEYRNGQPNGQGTYTFFATGEKYVGEFKDGKQDGQGTSKVPNGDWYSGEFKNGMKHGYGTYYYLLNNAFKGDIYIGEWRDNKINGLGILTKANGTRFEGIGKTTTSSVKQKLTYLHLTTMLLPALTVPT